MRVLIMSAMLLGAVALHAQKVALAWPVAPTPAAKACLDVIGRKTDIAKAALLCKQAADAAEKAPDRDLHLMFEYAAFALCRDGQAHAGLVYADEAVALVDAMHRRSEAAADAYVVRAACRQSAADIAGAEADVAVAERYRRERQKMAKADVKNIPTSFLKDTLLFHATLLKQLHRETDAAACEREAATL